MADNPTNRGGPLYWLKRRTRRFWICVALLPVLYVLSFGPACWITSRLDIRVVTLPTLYAPITWAMSAETDTTISRMIMGYAEFGAADNWAWGAIWEASPTPGLDRVRWEWVEIDP
jgi:hypothetical protein